MFVIHICIENNKQIHITMKQIYTTVFRRFGLIAIITLLFYPIAFAQWTINEGFEGGAIPTDWTVYDDNDDGEEWMAFQHSFAHTGDWLVMVQSYDNDGDDWLITPAVTISNGDVLNFYARAWYGTEDMEVKLSTTGNDINDFDVMLEEVSGLGSSYQEYNYNLSAYAGQTVYLAIRWIQDTYSLVVDDIKVGQPQNSDVGMFSIDNPGTFHLVGEEIIPSGTVKNMGVADVTTDFPVECTITDDQEVVVYTQLVTFTTDLIPGEAGAVTFPVWTPTLAGTYSITMFTALPNDGDTSNDTIHSSTAIVEHFGTGGPDDMSYRWIDSGEPDGPVYNWIEISETGTSTIMYGVNSFSGDDNFSEPIPIGFDFPFYGILRDSMNIDINGEILLAENQWYQPYPEEGWNNDGNIFNYYAPIPGYTEMPALISVFWDDLLAESGTGDIYFQTFGTSPDKYCVVQWNNLRFTSGNGGSQTLCFEVILHENGDIIMQYKNVDNQQSGGTIPHIFGQSATIAIQNDAATSGLCYLREIVENNTYIGPEPAGNILQNEMAIKFYVGEDNQPPILTHERGWNTFNTYADLTASISDVAGIASDTLYYNTGVGWEAMTHTLFEEPNTYIYSLQNLPLGSTVTYYFAATDNSVNSNRSILNQEDGENLSFNVLPTAGVDILLAMPGNKAGFQDYDNTDFPKYVQALDAAGVDYDIFNWAAFDEYSFPDSYDIIIGYANSSNANPIQDTLAGALINFMNYGTETAPKNVFMASDNMAAVQHPLPNARKLKKFFTAYLRGGYAIMPDGLTGPDSLGYYDGSIKGMANSPIGTEGVEIPVYANDPDVIINRDCPSWYADEVTNPEISSWGSYTFEDGPFNGHAYSYESGCAIWLDNLIYKSFFISFDISQLTSDTDINNMIQEALDWFAVETYTVALSANPEDGGVVSGEGSYTAGTTVTVEATASEGYNFINWTENGTIISSNTQYSFAINSNRTLVANFELQSFDITVEANPEEGGTVHGEGTYYYNETATVNATAATGYNFVNWTIEDDIVSTEATYSFTVTTDVELMANFELQNFTVTVTADPLEGGSVTGAGIYQYNETATLTAIPSIGYNFTNWTEEGTIVSEEIEFATIITFDRILVAHFELKSFTISVAADPQDGGNVSGAGTYLYNQTVTVSAVSETGYDFVNWMEDGAEVSNEQQYLFTATGDRSLVAHFELQTFLIQTVADPISGGTIEGGGSYAYNSTATVLANPEPHYEFINWTENGDIVSTDMEYSILVTDNHWLIAHFLFIDGLKDENSSDRIQLYPNPTQGVFHIETASLYSEQSTITLKNTTGQTIKTWKTNVTNEHQLMDISNEKTGVYFVIIQSGDHTITKRIILQ